MRAFVFPGQGAQTIGMGRELAETYPAARDVFDQVDEALGEKLSDLIWNGDIETLTLTQNAQPALMACSPMDWHIGRLCSRGTGNERLLLMRAHTSTTRRTLLPSWISDT